MRATLDGICRTTLCLLLLLLAGCPADRVASDVPLAEARPVSDESVIPQSGNQDGQSQAGQGNADSQVEVAAGSQAAAKDSERPRSEAHGNTEFAAADSDEAAPPFPMNPQPVNADEKTWPLFRGDAQSSGVAQSKLPEKLELLWKFRVPDGGFESTAAVVDGVVYVSDSYGKFFALDAATGEKRWEFEGKLGFSASPAVRDGRIFIGDLDGNVYCINARSGKKIWSHNLETEIGSSANFYKDTVLFGAEGGTLFCLKATDGSPVWKYSIDEPIRCSPTVVENRCFLAGCDGKLHVVDLDKGDVVDAVDIKAPAGSTPAVHGERAFFGTSDGTFFCVDWKKAAVVWTYFNDVSAAEIRSSAAVNGKQVIVGDRGRRVIAMNAESGDLLWEFLTKRNVDCSPVIVGHRVFFGADDGVIHGLDIAKGEAVWKYEAGGGFLGSPAVADGKLIIASDDGVVYCFGEKE